MKHFFNFFNCVHNYVCDCVNSIFEKNFSNKIFFQKYFIVWTSSLLWIICFFIGCDTGGDSPPSASSESSPSSISASSSSIMSSASADTTSPVILSNQVFTLFENVSNGTLVGTVTASDDSGTVTSYAITRGNVKTAFDIDNNGNLTTASAIDYESISNYALTVEVQDAAGNAASAIVSISIHDTNVITFIGKFGTEGAGNGQFSNAVSIVVYNSLLYVLDSSRHDVQVFDITNNYAFVTNFGGEGSANGQFKTPRGIAVYDNLIYVIDSDESHDDVQIFDGNTYAFVTNFGSTGNADGQFRTAEDITVFDNLIYVADSGMGRDDVQIFNCSTHAFTAKFGTEGTADGQFGNPVGIGVYNSLLYVLDSARHDVQVFDLSNNYTFVTNFGSEGDSEGQFRTPKAIAVDENFIYVVDSGKGEGKDDLQIFNSKTYEFVTNIVSNGMEDGQFDSPEDIIIVDNFIYIVDSGRDDVQVFLHNH